MTTYLHGVDKGVSQLLVNLLPGLRELRTPLAAGYLWLISLWLGLSHAGWLPAKRPPGKGEVAQLWSLGGTLGKTVVLAAVTFIAYLIGSFLEVDPTGKIMYRVSPLVLIDHKPWYLSREVKSQSHLPVLYHEELAGKQVARSLSSDARLDLLELLQRQGMIRFEHAIRAPGSWRALVGVEGTSTFAPDSVRIDSEDTRRGISSELDGDQIIGRIIAEMPQLASRLLVKNKDLFGKYDRLMAEASVRINVSAPLAVLLMLATWLSGLQNWVRALSTVGVAAFSFALLRQGILRAISARDVIAQALAIDEVQSRHIVAVMSAKAHPEELPNSTSTLKPADDVDQNGGSET